MVGQSFKDDCKNRISIILNSDHKDSKKVIDYFYEIYRYYYNRDRNIEDDLLIYKITKKDVGNVTVLLSHLKTFDKVRELIEEMFRSDDEFYTTGGGRTLGVLLSQMNKLGQMIHNRGNGTANLSAKSRKTLNTIANWEPPNE